MLNKFYSLIVAATACLCVSCTDNNEGVTHSMGKTIYYEDFLGYNYEPDTLKKRLVFEFCDDATTESTSFVMGFFKKNDDGTTTPMGTDVAQLFVNGNIADNNQFKVSNNINDNIAGKISMELGIVFNPDAESRQHHWVIKVLDNDKRIEEVQIEDGNMDVINFDAEKENVMNPLKKRIIWTSIIIVVLCIVWYFISRFIIWSSTSFSKMYIDYNDGYGATPIRTSGYYEIVCTCDSSKKDTIMERILKGERLYITNEFWTQPVTIKDGNRRNSLIFSGARSYEIEGEMRRKQPIEIINGDGKKVTIETT